MTTPFPLSPNPGIPKRPLPTYHPDPSGMNQVVMRFLPDGSLEVIRPDDLLVLRFESPDMDFVVGADGFHHLQQHRLGASGHLLVHFQPQAIAEPVYNDDNVTFPIPAMAAGNTQLAFRVPAAILPLKVTLENLLNWSSFTQVLASVAVTDAQAASFAGTPPSPEDLASNPSQTAFTFIEAPYRLLLSPDPNGEWQHQKTLQLNGSQNEAELWHTELTAPTSTGGARVRAIYSPDFTDVFQISPDEGSSPFTLGPNERNQIVHLSSDFRLGPIVASIAADQVLLTALGAWMQLRGDWAIGQDAGAPPPALKNYSVSSWHARSTMAREHYVLIVKEGHLLPFGHRAAVTNIIERVNGQTMYLRKSSYIVIRERSRDMTATGATAASQRQMPFQQVGILTKNSPVLDLVSDPLQFWPQVGKTDFLFDLVGTDIAGQQSFFQAPLYFVENSIEINQLLVDAVNKAMADRPASDLRGQSVALVPPSAPGQIDTAYPAKSLRFSTHLEGQYPGVVPVVTSAALSIPAIHQLTNVEAPVQVSYTPGYLASGIQNPDIAFAQIDQGAPLVKFASGDQSGGLMQPQLTLTHLAQSTGLAPSDFTDAGSTTAKLIYQNFMLLGGISLGNLFKTSVGPGTTPTIKATTAPDKTVTTVMTWKLDSQKLESFGPFVVSTQTPQTVLNLKLTRVQGLQASASSTTLYCDLNNFQLSLLGLIEVNFNSFVFDHNPGQKPSITVDVESTQFNAPLDFVQSLASIIPGNGFSNPPSLDLSPSGATLGYSLSIPPISVGAFSLENINLGSTLSIPFTGGYLVFAFHFADADHPFLMTGDFVTGGGYCALELRPDGLQRLDAALEFGGNVQLDLGVASGGVTTTGGFHFGLDKTANTTDYTVFVQASGALEVLDLIAVNTEFYVGLDYQTSHTFTGTASLSVEVSVLFFHKSVSLTMQKSYTS